MALSIERRRADLFKRAGTLVNDFLYGSSRGAHSLDSQVLLPYDIRYRLSVSDELKPDHLRSLTHSQVDAAFYLTTKALDTDSAKQRTLIEHGIEHQLRQPFNPQSLKPVLLDTIAQLPADSSVKGAKLKQMHRQGFDAWQSFYLRAANEMKEEGMAPVILAYAPLEGLGAFVNAFEGTGKPLDILVDTWIRPDEGGKQTPYCGYRINLDAPFGERVDFLTPDFRRNPDSVIFDDTKKTGRHLQEAWQFLSGTNDPIPQSRWRVVDNVS